jgi:hypothetical protein
MIMTRVTYWWQCRYCLAASCADTEDGRDRLIGDHHRETEHPRDMVDTWTEPGR